MGPEAEESMGEDKDTGDDGEKTKWGAHKKHWEIEVGYDEKTAAGG